MNNFFSKQFFFQNQNYKEVPVLVYKKEYKKLQKTDMEGYDLREVNFSSLPSESRDFPTNIIDQR